MGWVDQTPLWIVALACLAGLIAAHELGYRAGRFLDRRRSHAAGKDHLVASVLSLVGLMMAFTFASAQTEFRQRQELVVAEANALGSAYRWIQALPQPWRGSLSRQMVRYADVRGAFYDSTNSPASLSRNSANTAAEQAKIWDTAGDAVRADVVPALIQHLVQSLNEAFAVAASRRAAEDIRTPIAVLATLVISGLVTTAVVGFAGGSHRRYPYVTIAILSVQVLALCLILGLDRPGTRTVRINQTPMDRAIAAIQQSEAVKPAD